MAVRRASASVRDRARWPRGDASRGKSPRDPGVLGVSDPGIPSECSQVIGKTLRSSVIAGRVGPGGFLPGLAIWDANVKSGPGI